MKWIKNDGLKQEDNCSMDEFINTLYAGSCMHEEGDDQSILTPSVERISFPLPYDAHESFHQCTKYQNKLAVPPTDPFP